MKLDKAIELSNDLLRQPLVSPYSDYTDAIRLLIEAGKRIQELRVLVPQMPLPPLPGETPIIDTTRSEHTIKKILESPIGREPKD